MKTAYSGNYGETYTDVPPIPENPPTIVDKWGFEWLYLGEIDEDFIRVAKADEWGHVNPATPGPKNRSHFTDLHTHY